MALEMGRGRPKRVFSTAKQGDGPAVAGGKFAKRPNQIRTRHQCDRVTSEPGQPDNRPSVGHDQILRRVGPGKRGVLADFDKVIEIKCGKAETATI